MPVAKINVSIDQEVVRKLDSLIRKGLFPSRSKAIQAALEKHLSRLDCSRLALACAELDRKQERSLAEGDMGPELDEYPEY